MGQYDEAALALKAYLDMVEINLKVKSEGLVEDDLSHEQRVRMDIESEYDITTVQIAGSRLYSKELGKSEEGVACAQGALDNIHLYLQQNPHVTQLLSDAYKSQGVAYGLQASKGKDDATNLRWCHGVDFLFTHRILSYSS